MSIKRAHNKNIDTKLLLILAGFYLVFDLVYISKVLYMQNFSSEFTYFSWPNFLLYNILFDYVIVVGFMILIAISTKRFLNKNYPWVKIISIHILFSLIIGLVIRFVIDLYSILSGKLPIEDFDIKESFFKFMAVIDLNFLIYFAMIFIIYTFYYVKVVKAAEHQQRDLESRLHNTKMKMLSSQLQPHFLFNTLNSISVLTDIDAGKAKDTIADLSDFLRESLYNNNSMVIPLEKELRVLDYYLNILSVRFSDHLTIVKDVDESLLNKKVPALLIQPILENSIKHGYSYDHTDLIITLRIFRENGYMTINIENNGEEIDASQSHLMKKGVGLANINDRLSGIYDGNYKFEIKNKANSQGVISTIKIPI